MLSTPTTPHIRKHPLAECEICPLVNAPCVKTAFPSKPAQVAIVSRSPGEYEARSGEPFTGPSGKVLDYLLKENGVSRDDVILTNVVLCSPGKDKVPDAAIKACAPRLEQELSSIPLVLACGSEAVNLLVGRGSIDKHRGQRINRNGRTVIASNNPALVLYDDSTFPNLQRDFSRAFHPLPPPNLPTVEVIEDVGEIIRTCRDLVRHEGHIAIDIESRGGLSHKATLISLQFSVDGSHAIVFGERDGAWRSPDAIKSLSDLLRAEQGRTYIYHGGKFDTKILRYTYGINARVDHDTMLLSYALDERSGTDERVGVHGLDYLLMDTFAWPYYSSPSIERAKRSGVIEDYDEFYKYAGMDVGGTYQLFYDQYPRAEKDSVLGAYQHLLLRGNAFLTGVELNGMIYDKELAADLHEFEVLPELQELILQMQRSTDNPLLNPGSHVQMAHLYYDTWGIKHALQSRPDMARSVDDSARQEIIEGRFKFRGETTTERDGNLIRNIPAVDSGERRSFYTAFTEKHDRYQKLSKQSNTYLIGMIRRADADEDSRIYTQLNLHGTNSGRLSSSRPNLQNITRTKEGLPDIRQLFRASTGRLIVQADFSQAELRCIAQFSGDSELTRIYRDDLSLHRETATRFYGPDYTSEQYQTCKNVNFGVFYQQGAETFQEKHGIPKDKAQAYINWIWKTFTGVREWENEVEKEIRTKRVLVSPFGRKRRFHLITRENIQAAIREGINFYPQSTASDLTLCAGIKLFGTIEDGEYVAGEVDTSRAACGITVHDSIVTDVDEDYIDEYSTICLQVMSSIAHDELGWTLPFKAELGVGSTWGEAK